MVGSMVPAFSLLLYYISNIFTILRAYSRITKEGFPRGQPKINLLDKSED
jgi:hypothetical protein